jgi:multidrug efflux pump subunit AcrA (membrane-fusion protein)
VFVVERGVARARPVTIGARRGASLPVTEGLQGGERVVVDPPPSLEDGDRVRIQEG